MTIATIRPVGSACNLRCKYCYAESSNKASNKMTLDTYKNLSQKIIDYTLDEVKKTPHMSSLSRKYRVEFLWHGGEPLLVGPTFYKNALKAQDYKLKELRKRKIKILNKVQTNGTLVTDPFIRIFKKYSFGVGFSLDGPKEINDKTRVYPDGRGTFDDIFENALKLKSKKILSGCLLVVNKFHINNAPKVFDFFNDNGFNLQLNPLCMAGRALENKSMGLTPNQYASFLKDFFKLYLTSDPQIRIRDFDEIIDAIILNKPLHICTYSGGCKHGSTWGFDWNGDIYPCNRWVGLNFKLGNLNSCAKLADLKQTRNFKILDSRDLWTKNSTKCVSCALGRERICSKTGGCSYNTYVTKKTLFSHDDTCDAVEAFYIWAKKEILRFDNGWINELKRTIDNKSNC